MSKAYFLKNYKYCEFEYFEFSRGVGPPSSHLDQRLNLDKYTGSVQFFIYEGIAIERRTDFHAKIASLGRINGEKMYKLK